MLKRSTLAAALAATVLIAVPLSARADEKSDLKELVAIHKATDSGVLRNCIAELMIAHDKVTTWERTTGAPNTNRDFNKDGELIGYTLAYNDEEPDEFSGFDVKYQRIGKFAHELVHVACNESYDKDFVNYHNDSGADIPAPTFKKIGKTYRMENEGERQEARKVKSADKKLTKLGKDLTKLARKTSSLTDAQKNEVDQKLAQYQARSPHVEGEAPLVQVLIWCHYWQSKDLMKSKFYKALEKACKGAYDRRQKGKEL
jgi:hypothetical protein